MGVLAKMSRISTALIIGRRYAEAAKRSHGGRLTLDTLRLDTKAVQSLRVARAESFPLDGWMHCNVRGQSDAASISSRDSRDHATHWRLGYPTPSVARLQATSTHQLPARRHCRTTFLSL